MVAITSILSAVAIATLAGAMPTNNQADAKAVAEGAFAKAEAATEVDFRGNFRGNHNNNNNHRRNTYKVTAGFDGKLIFNPERIRADRGDIIEVHYLPKNHSVVQSSFQKPCEPLNGQGIFSGFNFATMQGESDKVFRFEVPSEDPLWFYCSQTVGSHCQMGMAFVINENARSGNTLDRYKKAANLTETSISPPLEPFGGVIAKNRNSHY